MFCQLGDELDLTTFQKLSNLRGGLSFYGWPFKNDGMKAENKVVKTILCIPGFWKSYPLGFIENGNEKFLAVSYGLIDVVNKRTYWLELCDHDNRMRKSFEVAGRVTVITEKFLEEVDKHTSVMYMTGETGNFDDARFIAKAAFALLSTGGIGVKVETTGKAFTQR